MDTEQTIQRLVDNQLDDHQRSRFLSAADQQPELWRQMALAFIEDQVWSTAITGQPAEDSWLHPTPQEFSGQPNYARSATSFFQKPWWLALAAGALLALTIAVRLVLAPGVTGPIASPASPTTGGPMASPETNLVSNDEPYMLQMADNLQIPLYRQMAPMREHMTRGVDSDFDPALQNLFQNAGLTVQPDVRYITGNAPDGRSFIVPVQQYRIQSNVQ